MFPRFLILLPSTDLKVFFFKSEQGLRQGDSLSPFLFLICNEGLSSLLRLSVRNDLLKGIKASRHNSLISHLLFSDDNILFEEASLQCARVLKDLLKEYEWLSGQCVNFDKSTVFFSKNTCDTIRTHCC